MTKTESAHEATNDVQPVVRDANFVRLVADHIAVVDLGRDFEFAFVAVGNPIAAMESIGDPDDDEVQQKFTSRVELTETGRVRISPFTALNVAMNTLNKLVAKGIIDTSALKGGIEEMISRAPSSDDNEDEK